MFQTLASPDASEQAGPGSLSFSPDGTRLASASLENAVHIWDTATGKRIRTLPMPGPVYAVAWHPHDTRIVVGGQIAGEGQRTGFLQTWDTVTGRMGNDALVDAASGDWPIPEGPPVTAQWIQEGESVMALFDAGNGEVRRWIPGEKLEYVAGDVGGSGPTGISYTTGPDTHYAVAYSHPAVFYGTSPASSIEVGAGLSFGLLGYVATSGSLVRAMTWSADGRFLAVIDGRNALLVVNRTQPVSESYKLEPAAVSSEFAQPPRYARWLANGQLIYVHVEEVRDSDASDYEFLERIAIRDVMTDAVLWAWEGISTRFGYTAQRWALSDDLKTLAIVQGYPPHSARDVITMTASSNAAPSEFVFFEPPGGVEMLYSLHWSADGRRVAATENGVLNIWDAPSGQRLTTASIPDSFYLSWSPDGRFLAGGYCAYGSQKSPFLVDAATGQIVHTLGEVKGGEACDLAWGPSGRSLALVSKDNQVRIWNTLSGKLLQTLPGYAVRWSPSGERLAILTDTQAVQVFDTSDARLMMTLAPVADRVRAVAFRPDDQQLVTADSDGVLRVWELRTGTLVAALAGHKGAVLGVRWSPDGRQILSYGEDMTLRLWSAP